MAGRRVGPVENQKYKEIFLFFKTRLQFNSVTISEFCGIGYDISRDLNDHYYSNYYSGR